MVSQGSFSSHAIVLNLKAWRLCAKTVSFSSIHAILHYQNGSDKARRLKKQCKVSFSSIHAILHYTVLFVVQFFPPERNLLFEGGVIGGFRNGE